MIESAAGETSAAPKPWSARAPISIVSEVASPLSSEATAKIAVPATNSAPPADQVGQRARRAAESRRTSACSR